MHPYDPVGQWTPIGAAGFSAVGGLRPARRKATASSKAAISSFFVRRGYVHIIANVRGTGNSGAPTRSSTGASPRTATS